jgi:carboxymethylenebutenolidase
MEIQTERVQIPVAGGTMGGYLARPADSEARPAVVVWMEIFGVNSHIREVTERVAREGYVALAPDFFHRTAPGLELSYQEPDFEKGIAELSKLKADQMITDAKAALAYLRGRSDVRGEKLGVMGFCIGGHMTYLTACETDVAAAASFYGGGIAAPQGPGGAPPTIGRTGKIRGKILCLFGGKDPHIPLDQVEQVRGALAKAGVDGEVLVYDDADHGFFCDQRGSYDKVAAEDAWKRVKALFAEQLG